MKLQEQTHPSGCKNSIAPAYSCSGLFFQHFISIVVSFSIFSFLGCKEQKTKINTDSKKDSSITYAISTIKPLPESEKKRLNYLCSQWYDSLLNNKRFNGAVLVAKNGNVVFEKYQGNNPPVKNNPVTDTTPFHIASVTKTFTAMSVLKLWQEGKIDIDQQYSAYFPAFNYPDVTVRCLLNHRSGLPNYLYFMEDLGWNNTIRIKNQDVLDWLINRKAEFKDISKPDTHFTYCNTNYVLLALLVEKISALTYPAYVKVNFFDPLEMKHSFVFTEAETTRITQSYDARGDLIAMNQLDLTYGDKNIYSTPKDLLIWHRFLSGGQLFTTTTLAQAYTPYSNEKKGIRNYGLGWRMNIYPDGRKMIYHNGWWHGNNASFIRLLDEDACIVVIGNRQNRNIYKAKYLIELFGSGYKTDEEEEGSEQVHKK
jgi:CubicO group peptidase (beta-lactamase class C family)